MAEEPRSFRVIIDTREKYPWHFTSSYILGTETRALNTGDYTVEGLEDVLCIERKRNVNEIANNITTKRFANVLERMKDFPHKYIMLESSIQKVIEYPFLEDLPKSIISKIKLRGPYLLKCLNRIQVRYGVHIVYCGNADNAVWIATNIMREVVDIYGSKDHS